MQRAAIFMQAEVHRAELERDAVLVRPHVTITHGQARIGSLSPLVRSALGRLSRGIQLPLPAARRAAA